MIDLYGMSSPNVLKILIMLEETDLEHRYTFVNVAAGEQFAPEFVALNPTSKVPVIIDDDGYDGKSTTVFESGAILLYLAEKSGSLLPRDPAVRMVALQWLMVQISSVGPICGQATHFIRFAPPEQDYSLARYRTLAGRLYDQLDARLDTARWLGGDEYSIADIATYPWVSLYHDAHGMSWSDHPHLKRWVDEVAARSAVATAVERYNKLMSEDPSFSPDNPPEGLDRFFGRGQFSREPAKVGPDAR